MGGCCRFPEGGVTKGGRGAEEVWRDLQGSPVGYGPLAHPRYDVGWLQEGLGGGTLGGAATTITEPPSPCPALVCPDTLFRRTITLIARWELASQNCRSGLPGVLCYGHGKGLELLPGACWWGRCMGPGAVALGLCQVLVWWWRLGRGQG